MSWLRSIGARIRHGSSGAIVTVVTAALLGSVLTLGATGHAPEVFDGNAWLWSRQAGELARVNANSGTVDLRTPLLDSRGHPVRVTQDEQNLLLHDLKTGRVTSMDLTRMGFSGSLALAPGADVAMLLSQGLAVIVDRTRGLVRSVDPANLQARGEPLQLPAPLVGGAFDASGTLWLGLPEQGTVVAIDAASGGKVEIRRTVPVAAPGQELAISVLDRGVLAVDRGGDQLVVVSGPQIHRVTAPVQLRGALVPERTVGALAAVTVPQAGAIVAVENTDRGGPVHRLPLPTGQRTDQPALPFSGRVYVPDQPSGTVRVLDLAGTEATPVRMPQAQGDLELQVREQHLFINSADAPVACVVDSRGAVKVVDKYGPKATVPGPGDPTASPTPTPDTGTGTPSPRPTPSGSDPPGESGEPGTEPPGPPVPVTALAGDGRIDLQWGRAAAGSAPVDGYRVEWAGGSTRVAGRTLSTTIGGLRNGQTYRFRVTAHNRHGWGPPALSGPVVPVDRVPASAGTPTASAAPGRVTVTWAAVPGARDYVVVPLRNGDAGSDPPQTVTGTSAEFAGLAAGHRYRFTVTARNDAGGAAPASPLSNEVVPYAVPGRPGAVAGRQVGPDRYEITWTAAAANGRPVQQYQVRTGDGQPLGSTAGGARRLTVAATGLTRVTVSAVNAAGEGAAGSGAVTAATAPVVQITDVSVTASSVRVRFTVSNGGITATCTTTAGGRSATGCGTATVTGLAARTRYKVTVQARNPMGTGEATATVTTDYPQLGGVVTCQDAPTNPDPGYCTSTGGIRVFPRARWLPGTELRRLMPGSRIVATCRVTGEHLAAGVYNRHKASDQWLRLTTGGYIAWVWVTLDNGDDVNALPRC
ncbi:fibronectin type III domain-containing protein [Micromonospora sp. NPDC003197]